MFAQRTIEDHLLFFWNIGAQVVEYILLEAFEFCGALCHRHGHAALEPTRGSTVQPVGAEVDVLLTTTGDAFTHVEVDLQPVRFHRFDADVLVEGGATHYHLCVPYARGCIGSGGTAEAVYPVHRGSAHVFLIQPSPWVGEFEHHRMVFGQFVQGILKDEREVE